MDAMDWLQQWQPDDDGYSQEKVEALAHGMHQTFQALMDVRGGCGIGEVLASLTLFMIRELAITIRQLDPQRWEPTVEKVLDFLDRGTREALERLTDEPGER